jgi:hypothetical protein
MSSTPAGGIRVRAVRSLCHFTKYSEKRFFGARLRRHANRSIWVISRSAGPACPVTAFLPTEATTPADRSRFHPERCHTVTIATPNRVTAHPAEVLNEEFLKPLGMSVNALAIALRVPATRIGAIVKASGPYRQIQLRAWRASIAPAPSFG